MAWCPSQTFPDVDGRSGGHPTRCPSFDATHFGHPCVPLSDTSSPSDPGQPGRRRPLSGPYSVKQIQERLLAEEDDRYVVEKGDDGTLSVLSVQ